MTSILKTSCISSVLKYLLILIAPSVLVGGEVCNLYLAAESGSTNGELSQSIIQLHLNEHVSWNYQTKDHFSMQVHNIMYINQGAPTVLSVYSDDTIVTSFGTNISNNNQPINSGQLGQDVVLPIGNHSIKVQVIHTDEYGIDIGTVTVTLVAKVEQYPCPTVNPDTNNNKFSTNKIVVIVCTPIGTIMAIGIFTVSVVAISLKYCKRCSYKDIDKS